MRYLLVGFALLATGGVAEAQNYSGFGYCSPWCLAFSSGGQDCSYLTFEQCRISSEGVGGSCEHNPLLSLCTRPRQPTQQQQRRPTR